MNLPQQYQNLQRLLQWLGFQVQVVSNEAAQKSCWETGKYSVLITEFLHIDLFKISHVPLFNIGVFGLSNCILKMLKQLQVARGSEVASGIFKEDFQNYGLSFFFFSYC
mgnify:CR=1 FL=1